MKKLFFSLLIILFISACGSSASEEDSTSHGDESEGTEEVAPIPEVEVGFEEDPLPVNEATTIQATVTQGGEPVEDAEYVDFEIWNEADGEEASTTIESEHVGDGVYQIEYTFEKAGSYQLYAHTQVADLHTMPKESFQVGEGDAAPSEHPEGQSHDHGENDGKFMVHIQTEEAFTSGKESELVTHINHMEVPFEDGVVRFEISSDQLEAHQFIDAEESNPGEYKAAYEFPSPGTYNINVHYEKPDQDIHGHKDKAIEVQ
ncbi:FixH family protein [Halobacillus litoralis]|uniref:FixH family protein n=1 Tax=Halobacillus litoralis TaxID=45668 RepID=UPI001CD427CD|nr:FixH family protein [Halobacillus litoralis]MCA0971883.1 FixH family protein [Halobacillus litoralis]